jgi:tryptophanyl-tRNA synthetase
MNLVTVPRLMRNPTIRSETEARGFGTGVPAGFLCYPVSQAADITAFGADLVPAGEDQLPLIEQTNEIVSAVNRLSGQEVLRPCKIRLSKAPRLPGIDGKGKMSKSGGNAIFLKDDPDTLRKKVMSMFTDPGHLRVSDPGQIDGNVVFDMLFAFDPDRDEVMQLADHYRAGGLGDMPLKRRLLEILSDILGPIRQRREELAQEPGLIDEIIASGTERANETAEAVRAAVRKAFMLH